MRKTDIFTATVGGPVSTSRNIQIVATLPGEQVHIQLTKRTDGNVRVTVQEASANPSTGGVGLALDEPLEFALGENQRLFLMSDENVDPQSVDVVVSGPTLVVLDKPAMDSLNQMVQGIVGNVMNSTYCPPKKYK